METKVKELFATILEVPADKINDKATPENIENWDSFKHIVLVSAFEEEFNISVEPEDVVEMYKNYETFKTIIMEKLK